MQSKASRVALIGAALVIAVVAFLLLRPTDDDEEPTPTPAAQEAKSDGASDADEDQAEGAGGGDGGHAADREPAPTEIELRNGSVVGGVEEIEVERGERIDFVVESDAPDQIHVHGYELTEDVQPGTPTRFSFIADSEGIYEVEAHDIGHVVIAELRVTPS